MNYTRTALLMAAMTGLSLFHNHLGVDTAA
jgi:hypothetical protein